MDSDATKRHFKRLVELLNNGEIYLQVDQAYDIYLFVLLLSQDRLAFAACFIFADLFPAIFIVLKKFR